MKGSKEMHKIIVEVNSYQDCHELNKVLERNNVNLYNTCLKDICTGDIPLGAVRGFMLHVSKNRIDYQYCLWDFEMNGATGTRMSLKNFIAMYLSDDRVIV